MSEARAIRVALEQWQNAAASHRRSGLLLAICLVAAMAVAEVLFLQFVAGPDSTELMVRTEGIAPPP